MATIMWKAQAVDADKYTANVELNDNDGYFIRALPGQKTVYPVQACLYMDKPKVVQNVHNIIIAEEGSELHIITGCATATRKKSPACISAFQNSILKKMLKLRLL